MLDFKEITLSDKERILAYTLPFAPRDCEFAFSNLFCWHFAHKSSYIIENNLFVIRFQTEDNRIIYTLPIGKGNLSELLPLLEADAATFNQPLRIQAEMTALKTALEPLYAGQFDYVPHRGFFDYIYLRQHLAELKGNTYQRKRNHVNHFKREFAYQYVELTPDRLDECLAFENKWRTAHDYEEQQPLTAELIAMQTAARNFEGLGLRGGAIMVNNEMVAFTFGAPINHDTFDIMVEKSNGNINGAYSVINQEFAARIPDSYLYIDREEDLDIPGLRQSKLSYYPTILFEKSIATKIR